MPTIREFTVFIYLSHENRSTNWTVKIKGKKKICLYRATEALSSVQSIFITEETVNKRLQSQQKEKNKIIKLAISLPLLEKKAKNDSKHHIYTPPTLDISAGKTVEKVQLVRSHLHNVLYWSIRRHCSVSTSELLAFFLSFFSFLFFWGKKTNDETINMHGEEEEEEGEKRKTGTDHQLQYKQWKSVIASHFRRENKKNFECTSLLYLIFLKKWHRHCSEK